MVQTAAYGCTRVKLWSNFRAGSRPWAGSVVVLALTATAALTAATAARRTDTAFSRALRSANSANAYVASDASHAGPDAVRVLDALERSDVVAEHGRFGGVIIAPLADGDIDARFNTGTATGYMPYDTRVGATISRFSVVDGRAASPDRADEVVVNRSYVRLMHPQMGDTVAGARLWPFSDFGENGEPDPSKGTPVSLRIVGVIKTPDETLTTPSY